MLLAAGKLVYEVAAEVGVNRHTVSKWQSEPKFAATIDRYKNQVVAATIAGMASDMIKASRRLALLVDDEDKRIALVACKSFLELALKARSLEETERKIQELTDRINALTKADDAS